MSKNYTEVSQILLKNTRILVYVFIVLVCSLLDLPEDYKIDKRNILNQWFVKNGWGWTSLAITPIIFKSIEVSDKEAVSRTIFRLIISTVLWYTSVNLFQYIDTTTGFDISGHTFLLMFSNLMIMSELKLSRTCSKQHPKISTHAQIPSVTLSKIFVLSLSILWDFMLLQTALYYHTILQKAIAAVWAIGSWYILHHIFYHKSLLEFDKPRGRGDRCKNEHISVNS